MIIKEIQEFYINLFLINYLVVYQKFHQPILFFKKTFNSEFSYIEVWFTDQKSQALEMEDKINLTLVMK